jgi:hypothetical protein
LSKRWLPGAPLAAERKGRGQRQNTKAAQAERAERAAEKRTAIEAQRIEAEARRGKPRKQRSDKGTMRGPNKITKEKMAQAEAVTTK